MCLCVCVCATGRYKTNAPVPAAAAGQKASVQFVYKGRWYCKDQHQQEEGQSEELFISYTLAVDTLESSISRRRVSSSNEVKQKQ